METDPTKCEMCGSEQLTQTPLKSTQYTKNVITFGVSIVTCNNCNHERKYYYTLMTMSQGD